MQEQKAEARHAVFQPALHAALAAIQRWLVEHAKQSRLARPPSPVQSDGSGRLEQASKPEAAAAAAAAASGGSDSELQQQRAEGFADDLATSYIALAALKAEVRPKFTMLPPGKMCA